MPNNAYKIGTTAFLRGMREETAIVWRTAFLYDDTFEAFMENYDREGTALYGDLWPEEYRVR